MNDTTKGKLTTIQGGANTGKPSPRTRKALTNPTQPPKEEKDLNPTPPTGEAQEMTTVDHSLNVPSSEEDFDKGHRDGHVDTDEDKEKVEGQSSIDDDGKIGVDGKDGMLTQKLTAPKFERQTKIEKSRTDVSIKSMFKEWKKDQLIIAERKKLEDEAIKNGTPLEPWDNPTTMRFDEAIQRGEVWSDLQKSDLIHSILYGYYVPPVLVRDSNDGKKWFLDGKQRITTLMTFMNGNWALSKKTEDVYGHKIAGFKFKDLTEEMQDEIQDETITLIRMKNMTTPEKDKMFVKLNGGSPLTRIELTSAKHSELIESISELQKLKFFKEDVELSKKARVRLVDREIILQIAMLFEEGKEKIKGFGASQIEDYVLRLKESGQVLSDEMIRRIEEISTYLELSFEEYEMDEIKKALKKIHIPIIFWNAEKAIKIKLQPKLFGDFIRSFLISNYTVTSKYGKSCQSGSSKKENVITRVDEMSASLDQFMEMLGKAETMEQGVASFDKMLAEINGVDRQSTTDDGNSEEEETEETA